MKGLLTESKGAVVLLALIVTIALPLNTFCESTEGNLVAYWPLDEQTGITISDSSGNGLDGTAYGASIVYGKKGKARSFDGINDYIEVADNDLLDVNDSITIMLWVKIDTIAVEGFLISKRVYDGEQNYSIKYACHAALDTIAFSFGPNPGSIFGATGSFNDNQWHHFAISFTFGNPTSAKWVKDGSVSAGFWHQGTGSEIPNTNSANLLIGRQLSGSPGYAKGTLDQIRIFHRALTATDIQAIYEQELSANPYLPTLSQWGIIILFVLLLGIGLYMLIHRTKRISVGS